MIPAMVCSVPPSAHPRRSTPAWASRLLTLDLGLLYNLYADKLLGLDFVDQSIYDMQSTFYPTVALEYGVPLDSRHTWAKGDWEMFCAAIASTETRDMFISKLATWIGQTNTNRPMTDLYDAAAGTFPVGGPSFMARPVMGGTFALLALQS